MQVLHRDLKPLNIFLTKQVRFDAFRLAEDLVIGVFSASHRDLTWVCFSCMVHSPYMVVP